MDKEEIISKVRGKFKRLSGVLDERWLLLTNQIISTKSIIW